MSAEDNLALVHRFLDEVVNTGNLDGIDTLFAPDHVAYYPGFPPIQGLENWKQVADFSYSGFPDTHTTFEDEMAMGDKVVVRYTVRGTHTGAFMGIPATGKPVEYSGMAIFRIADGKIVEQWQVADQWGLMQQITSSTAQSVTEPLGRRETEGLQHQVQVTPPLEESR